MFDARERSRFNGNRIRLFIFKRQSLTWRFCTADRDLTIGGFTYLSANIDRSEIKQTVERAKDKLTIRMAYLLDAAAAEYPPTQSLGDNWRPYAPIDPISVICMTTHYGDPDPPAVDWMGQVIQPKFSDVELELTCEPNNSIALARNQGAKWQTTCWKTPYSTGLRGCNMPREDFEVNATLTGVSGLTLTSAAFAASPFPLAGGFLTFTTASGLLIRRGVDTHVQGSNTLKLMPGGPNPTVGLVVVALPTCPRTWAACYARDNTDNYGGAIYRKGTSPQGVSMSWN